MFLLDPKYIFGALICLLAYICYKYQSVKELFLRGLWYNDTNGIYLYISDKKKNGKIGGYIVKDKSIPTGDLDTNEPFEMDITLGILNNVHIITHKTKKLPKEMDVTINIAKGTIKMPMKEGKSIILYKDTYTSNHL